MKVIISAATHVGQFRIINEDCYGSVADQNLALVCDGVGGHKRGDVASRFAVETIEDFYQYYKNSGLISKLCRNLINFYPNEMLKLIAAIRLANYRIYQQSNSNVSQAGMATTLVALKEESSLISICHVGDSRAYRIRNNKIELLTKDHRPNMNLTTNSSLNQKGKLDFSRTNIITRALGVEPSILIDLRVERLLEDDLYLLCSDGLTSVLAPSEIKRVVMDLKSDLPKAAQQLVLEANIHGGYDNITVSLINFTSVPKKDHNLKPGSWLIPKGDKKIVKAAKNILKNLYHF